MDVDDMARGIVSSLLIDQVTMRGKMVQWVALAIGALSIIGLLLFDSNWRWLLAVTLIGGFGIAVLIWFIRAFTVRTIRRFAEPKDIAEHRAVSDRAIDQADLATGPVNIVKTLWRLRIGGTGKEVDRLRGILSNLVTELR